MCKNHQGFGALPFPSRKLELSHIVKSLCKIFNGFQFCSLLGCRTLAAIPVQIWLSEHKWPTLIYVFLALLKTSSLRKFVNLVPFIVSPSLQVSPSLLLKKPLHSMTLPPPVLHDRSAIRWVMSCAWFPPDRVLCFMAVSISSEETLSLKNLSSAFLSCLG